MQTHEAIKTDHYLTPSEIEAHLDGVEYIIMAAPTTRDNARAPIHFTIFLNTTDELPTEIQQAILEKFADQYKLTNIQDVFSQIDAVAFAVTNQETYMPMHLYKEDDKKALDHGFMHILDFEADSVDFGEAKAGSTGWSYSYN
ncbi:MAG: hypothetical protein WBF77_02520 [Sulfurimonadaceae bacterium]